MLPRLVVVGILLAFASVAEAAALRVSAEPPLSTQRLADTLRSYLDGAEVTVTPAEGAGQAGEELPAEMGTVSITLRGSRGLGEDAEVVLVDGEETILARLPGALRTEDLYRTAALKVQALLQRRAATGTVTRPTEATGYVHGSFPSPSRDRLWLDASLAWMLPTNGLSREGLRLGSGLRCRGAFLAGRFFV